MMLRAGRIIWWVKSHSLSYQAITLTTVPSTTVVSSRSATAAMASAVLWTDELKKLLVRRVARRR
jgi:hypothetical protein